MEVERRRLGIAPVALSHARPRDPDLPLNTFPHLNSCTRIYHDYPLITPGPPATHSGAKALDARHRRRISRAPAGDEQRGFGYAVARVERLSTEAAVRESLSETLQRIGKNRLRTVERQLPAREIQAFSLLCADAPYT